jgi:hypothetical protein
MDHADEVRSICVEFEGEVAFGVGLGSAGFFHALTQRDENDFVSCAGFPGGGVFHRAGEGLGGGE